MELAEDPHAPPDEIARRVGNRLRREERKEAPMPPGTAADAKLKADSSGDEQALVLFVEREAAWQVAVRAGLSGSERETFGLLLDCRSVEEVARTRGKSATQIRQEKFRALKKIAKHRRAVGP